MAGLPKTSRLLPGALLAAALASSAPSRAAKLEIVQAALHQYDGGPPLPASFEFFPGDTVFLTFRIAGFKTVEKDDEDHLWLAYRIEAFDPEGLPIRKPGEGRIATVLTYQDKKQKWMPLVRYEAPVPPTAPSGAYRIAIHVEDLYAKTEAELEKAFQVRGRDDLEPSETLVIQNFHFYRSETSMRPLREPVYRPGSSVWARFDIVGYRFGENNRFSIDYGVKVLRANGKVLFEQPVAVSEEKESFYPQRYLQGGLSLNLTPDLSPGDYTLIVTVRDHVGGQAYEEEHVFTVR